MHFCNLVVVSLPNGLVALFAQQYTTMIMVVTIQNLYASMHLVFGVHDTQAHKRLGV